MSTNGGGSTVENIEKIERLYSAIAAGDWETVDSILSPDIIVKEADSLPYGGTYNGHAGFKDLMARLADTWTDLRPIDFNFSAVGETVLATFTLLATSKATGRELNMPLIEKWTFGNGRVVDGGVFYYDTHEVRKVCGLA